MSEPEAWRTGVLFSASEVTSIIERSQRNGFVLAIDEINRLGGVRGRPIEAVFHDPGSVAKLYGTLAKRLIVADKIGVIFGGYRGDWRIRKKQYANGCRVRGEHRFF